MVTQLFDKKKNMFIESTQRGRALSLDELIQNDFNSSEVKMEYSKLISSWFKLIAEFDFLPDFSDSLEEIFIHGENQIIYRQDGHNLNFETNMSKADLQLAYDYLTLNNSIEWNYTNPFVSFRTNIRKRDVRVTLTHFSISPTNQSKAFIRILNNKIIPLDSFTESSSFLETCIRDKKNIIVAGSTGSGKTTLLNTFLDLSNEDEHPIILEDTYELISPNGQTTRLISDSTNEKKSLSSYMKYAMRMSPDRIVLGEIRGEEIVPFLLAMNTGHNGLLTSVHANSAKDAVHRLALLFKIYSSEDLGYELILKLITQNIDYIIFTEKKKVKEVIRLIGSDKESIHFEKCLS